MINVHTSFKRLLFTPMILGVSFFMSSLNTQSFIISNEVHGMKFISHYNSPKEYTLEKVGFSRNLISPNGAVDMLNNMDDKQLNAYLLNMMPKEVFHSINNREFAQRAINELYKSNKQRKERFVKEKRKWLGQITLNHSKTFPSQNEDLSTVNAYQKIFAHLQTEQTSHHNGRIFVSWIHQESGEVHIFNMKYINAHSNKNWVSLKLDDGWHTGTYEIVFYQFSNQLKPLAQTTLKITKVIGKKEFDYNNDNWDKGFQKPSNNDDIEIPNDFELSQEELEML